MRLVDAWKTRGPGQEGPQWSLDEKGWAFSIKRKEGSSVRSSWKRSYPSLPRRKARCLGTPVVWSPWWTFVSVVSRLDRLHALKVTWPSRTRVSSREQWAWGFDYYPSGITSTRTPALPLCPCYILIVIDWGPHGPLLNGGGEERREERRGDTSSNEALIICHKNTNAEQLERWLSG